MKQLVAITGPSCGGKSTLRDAMLRNNDDCEAVVTCTTRRSRKGEVEGVDYHFVDRVDFVAMLDSGELLEYVEVSGELYGIEKAALERISDDKIGVAVVTPAGMDALRKWCNASEVPIVAVLASAPIEVLRQRLMARRSITAEKEIAERLRNLAKEVEQFRSGQRWDVTIRSTGDAIAG